MNAVRVAGFHSWQLYLSFKPFAIKKHMDSKVQIVFVQIILLESQPLDYLQLWLHSRIFLSTAIHTQLQTETVIVSDHILVCGIVC